MNKLNELRKERDELKAGLAKINQQIKEEHAKPKTIEDYENEVNKLKSVVGNLQAELAMEREALKRERIKTRDLEKLLNKRVSDSTQPWRQPQPWIFPDNTPKPEVHPFWNNISYAAHPSFRNSELTWFNP